MSKKKATQMSDIETVAETEVVAEAATKSRKGVVRGPQKVFSLLKITLADGSQLDPKNMQGITVELSLTKDKNGVIDALMNGDKLIVNELDVPKANATDAE